MKLSNILDYTLHWPDVDFFKHKNKTKAQSIQKPNQRNAER